MFFFFPCPNLVRLTRKFLLPFMSTRTRKRSRSSSVLQTSPGTPGSFAADLARDSVAKRFPRVSPTSAGKLLSLRKQLFAPMVNTSTQSKKRLASTSSTSQSSLAVELLQLNTHQTPPAVDEAPPTENFPGLVEAIRQRNPAPPRSSTRC